MISPTRVDAATVNIVSTALHGIAEEMGVNLLRSARSTIIREARDCSCALLDHRARLVAEADHAPIQMSSLALPLQTCLARHDPASLTPDDVFLINDPYAGGQHLQDLILFMPVFVDGQLVAFSGSVAHHIDIGGGAAGLTLDAAEIYAEGLRFPGMRLSLRDFDAGGVIADIVEGNFREPDTSLGDLRAQLAACIVGRERFQELSAKFGLGVVQECIDASLDRSETLMRKAIEEIPDGVYESTDAVDSGVLSPDPIVVRLRMTVSGDQVELDFAGTDPQTEDFLNVPIASTLSAALSAMTMMAVATGRRIPANEGCYRPISINVPEGSFLNPRPPAAVRARMCGAYRTFDAVLLALQQAMPERMPALGFHVNTTVGFTQRQGERFRIFIEDIGGGWGATPTADGQDMLDSPLSNCKITPVEVLELDHPYLRVNQYTYVPGSGGAGHHRGGLGTLREYEVLEEGVSFFAYGDRHTTPPPGHAGGGPGGTGSFSIVRAGESTRLASKTAERVRAGDLVRVVAGGGGGFGRPEERTAARIRVDQEQGKVEAEGVTP